MTASPPAPSRTSVACRYGRHGDCVGGADYGPGGYEGRRYGPCACDCHPRSAAEEVSP